MENKHRSGVLIGREPFKPAKVTVLSNEKVKIHSLGDEDTFGVIYPAVLDELDPLDDGEVETVINLDDYPLPKEGHIGYVKFENPNDYVRETEPRWFDVDEYRFEVVDEDTHPCAGVMYPAFLNDTPAEWRDLPPDGLTQEETESMVVLRT